MAVHYFVCDACDITVSDNKTHVHVCPNCGTSMRWDLAGIGIAAGDYYHESHSMAIHPDQIPEHRKLFPNIEVKPDGVVCFTGVKQQERYVNKCGFDKKMQRNRCKGVRI